MSKALSWRRLLTRVLPLALGLGSLGCEALFGGSSTLDPATGAQTLPGTQLPGAQCSAYGEQCVAGAVCREVGGVESREDLCVQTCAPGNCPGDTRCTTTPEGAMCLARCEVRADCGTYSPLLCIQTGQGEGGVCYPDGATSGEVVPKAAIAVVRVTVQGPSGSPGLEPGRTARVKVEIRNVGSRKLVDLTSIVEKRSALITDVQGAASGPYYLGFDTQLSVANVEVAVSPDAVAGAAVPLILHLKDGDSGAQFDLDIQLRVETALARLVLSRVELTRQGQPVSSLADGLDTRVRIYAQNIGLTSTQDASATLALAGSVTGSLEPKAFSYVSPGAEALIAEGNLTSTGAGAAVTATFAGTNFETSSDTVNLP